MAWIDLCMLVYAEWVGFGVYPHIHWEVNGAIWNSNAQHTFLNEKSEDSFSMTFNSMALPLYQQVKIVHIAFT